MIKKIGKLFSAILIGILLLTAAACTFFAEEERREIENIYYRPATQDEREGILVIIDYVGDEYPDSMFFLPNGEEGKEGNGISDVTAELVEDGARIKITVNYTDKTRDPSEFTFENSVFPTDFTCELDEETGDYRLSITLSNGDTSEFTIHNGIDGDRITSITTRVDEETGTTYIVITMAVAGEDGEPVVYEFPMPEGDKGEQGVGIASVRVDNYLTASDPSYVYLVIELTDGTSLTTRIPKVNNWTVGEDAPSPNAGSYGDFYFDRLNYKIYHKDNEGWTVIMDLSDKRSDTHVVRFMIDSGTLMDTPIVMNHGSYFYRSGYEIPTPEREGFTFDGWYTKLNEDGTVNVNAGRFTDLTPILSDMTLYAHFIPND